MMNKAPLWAAALAATTGCTVPAKSGDLGTEALAADYDVACDGNASVLTATFTDPSSALITYVTLEVGDEVSVSSGDSTEVLSELDLSPLISYVGALPLAEADTPFVFALTRELDGGAPDSEVTLPPPYEINGVNPSVDYSRGTNALSVAWSGDSAGDPMSLTVTGACIEDYIVDLEDESGSAGIDAGALVSRTGSEAETCDLTVTLSRTREGTLDSTFAGGSILARQDRSVTVSAAP